MVGRQLILLLHRLSLPRTTISDASGFNPLCSISSASSFKFGRWEQFRYMGSPARTLNKWQQKRLDEKKAIHKQKTGQLLDNASITDKSNSYKNSKNSAKQGHKDQISALADRFIKVGAVDLWNENDGPLTMDPPPTDTSKVSDSLNGGKVQKKDTLKYSLGKGGPILLSYSGRSSYGVKTFTEAEELDDGDTVKDSLCKSGSVLFRRSFSSGRSRKFNRLGASEEDEDLDDEWYGDRPFDSVGSFSEEEDAAVSSSKSKLKSIGRKGRSGSFSDEEETGQKVRRSSVVPKSLIEDEMELGNIIDEEMTSGMKFEEELLNGKRFGRFYDNDEEALRRSKFLSVVDSMENFSGPRSRERSFDVEDDWRDSRNPKTSRVGGSIRSKRQSMSGFGEELTISSGILSRARDDEDEKALRRSKSSRMGGFREDYSSHRSRERSFDENEGRRVSRNPKTGRVEGSMPSHWGSRSKRQSMGGFDKAEETGFRELGSNRKGRPFSSFSGSNRHLAQDFDLEKETEFEQLKSSRMGDFMSRNSIQQSRRESLREKTEDEDKVMGCRQTKAEDNWLKFGSRLKRETSRDMEVSEDEEEELNMQSLPGDFCKKEQPICSVLRQKDCWSWNVNDEGSDLSSSRCVVG